MFGEKVRAKPRAALQRQATPPSGQSPEAIWHQFYDTQTYVDNSTVGLEFFRATNSDNTLSNMPASGMLPSPQYFELYNICLDFIPAIGLSTSATTTGNLDDAALIMVTGRPIWTLSISDKNYGPYSLTLLHGTGGPSGFGFSSDGAEVIQYVRNEPGPGWNYRGCITIPPQVNFAITCKWAAAQNLTADVRLRISMLGILSRRVL